MEPVLERLKFGARVSIIRLRSLGDCVLTTPAIRLLKAHRPDLELTVVVEDRFKAIYENNPDIVRTLPPRATAIASVRPDLCINFHGGTRSIALTLASSAKFRAGFVHYRAQCTFNVHLPRAQEVLHVDRKVHTAEHLASAMFYLGVPQQEIPQAQIYAAPARRSQPYAVIHPFASSPSKTWPHFSELARDLGLPVVVVAGPNDDTAPYAAHEILRNAPLPEVASLLKSAAFFIGNDSGPAHIAAACGTPVVVLYGDSDPIVWAPWRAQAQTIVRQPIEAITPAEVQAAVESLRVRA